jgi:hypothetical protein
VNDTAYGVNGSPLTIEFIDEVNVITGGYMPEYGRALGGALSAVTKSGGNEFHGSIWGNFTPGALAGSAAASNATGGTGVVSVTNDLYNIGDFGATLGGYILKDKLWFFAGLQPSFQRYSWTRSFNAAQVDGGGNLVTDPATGQVVYTPIPNSSQRRFSDEKSLNFIGKLTFLASSDHRLSLSVTGTSTTGGGGASIPTRLPGGLQARNGLNAAAVYGGATFNGAGNIETNDSSYNVVGELNSSFLDKRLLLDLRVGWHHQLDEGLPGDGSGLNTGQAGTLAGTPSYILHPSILRNVAEVDQVPASVRETCSGPDATTRCGVLGYFTGGPGFIERLVLDSYQARGILTFLVNALGHHVLKAGVDANIGYYEHIKAYTGRNAYTEQPESTVPGPTAGSQPFAVFDAQLRVPQGAGPAGLPGPEQREVEVGHRRRVRPGQLEHPGQGHPQPRPALRHAHPRRGGRRGPDRAEGSVVAADRRHLGSHPGRPLEDLRELRAVLRADPPRHRRSRAHHRLGPAGLATSTAIRSRTASTTATPTPAAPAPSAPASTGA